MRELKEFFRDKKVRSVLDVGTGPGNFIKVLKEVFPDASVTGVDPDKEALAEAGTNFPGFQFSEMNGEWLDFADATFDVASISMALHHLSNVQKTLLEMQRVVRSGGWVIINELVSDGLNPAQEVHKMMHHFRSKIDRMNGICHNQAFTKREIVEQVEQAGLKVKIHFEHKTPAQKPGQDEIAERKQKLWDALETVKGQPDYGELRNEIPGIEQALEEHGFEMATRLVIVAPVEK